MHGQLGIGVTFGWGDFGFSALRDDHIRIGGSGGSLDPALQGMPVNMVVFKWTKVGGVSASRPCHAWRVLHN